MVWVHKDHLIFVNTLNEWIIICYKHAPSSRHLSSLEFVCRNLSWLVLDGPAVNVAMNRTTQARNSELSPYVALPIIWKLFLKFLFPFAAASFSSPCSDLLSIPVLLSWSQKICGKNRNIIVCKGQLSYLALCQIKDFFSSC